MSQISLSTRQLQQPLSSAVQAPVRSLTQAPAAAAACGEVDSCCAAPASGQAQACLSFFDTAAALPPEWQATVDTLHSEMQRIDKIPGFKADINVGRLKGMIQAIEGPSAQRVQALQTELKKAGYGRLGGDPPTEAGVRAGLNAYLHDLSTDRQLRPR